MSAIIQHAVLHHSGRYLNNIEPNTRIQYEDTKGNVIVFTGGTHYFNRTTGFPGGGCTDYSLTILDSFETVANKLLVFSDTVLDFVPIKSLSLEDLYVIKQRETNSTTLKVINYWIEKHEQSTSME